MSDEKGGFKHLPYSDRQYVWWDCTTMIKCECGQSEIVLEDEPRECRHCGRVYRLVAYVEVKEPNE